MQDLLREFDLDPVEVFAQAEFPAAYLSDPDNQVPLVASVRLLATCIIRTNCPHFGLLLGQRNGLDALGRLGFLARNESSVGSALEVLVSSLHMANRVVIPVLIDHSPLTTLNLLPYNGMALGGVALHDMLLAMAFRVLQDLCGPGWQPLQIGISRRKPQVIAAYSQLFQCPITFDAEISNITFHRHWLALPVKGANATLRRILSADLSADAPSEDQTTADDVRRLLHTLLPGGEISAETVARQLGLHPRTMHRRLAEGGQSFRSLLAEVRVELASHLLQNTGMPLSQVASMLGYADASAFSRAFRRWTGLAPIRWRGPAGLAVGGLCYPTVLSLASIA